MGMPTRLSWSENVGVIVVAALIAAVLLGAHFLASAFAPMPEEPAAIVPAAAPEIRVATPRPVEAPRLGFVAVFSSLGQPLIYEAVKGEVVQTEYGVNYTNTEGVFRQWRGGESMYSTSPFRLTQEPLIKTMTATQFREH